MVFFDKNAARAAVTIALLAALLWVIYLTRQTLFVIVLAVFLSYLIYPSVTFLQRQIPRLPRTAAVAIVYLLLLAIVVISGALLGTRITEEASELGQKLPNIINDPNLAERLPLPEWMRPVRVWLLDTIRSQFGSSGEQGISFVHRIAIGVVHFAGNLIYVIVIPILSFLLVKDASLLRDSLLGWFSPGHSRTVAKTLLADLNTLLAQYIRALLLLSIVAFLVYASVLSILGVPYAMLLAAVGGPLEFIPVFGPLLAAAIALMVAAISGYEHLGWLVAFFAAYRVFQDYALSPYLMRQGLELHPLLVILGILFGEEVGGVAGMFLAVPVLAAAKIIAQRVRDNKSSPRTG